MIVSLLKNVVYSTVSRWQENPNMREAMDTLIYTGSELLMSAFFVGGPLLLGAFCFFTAATVAFSSFAAKKWRLSEEIAKGLAWDLISVVWKLSMKIWHGHEYRGFENIPKSGGALIIWFHGPMPVDYFGLIAEVWFRQRRILKTVMDRILVAIPGSWMFTDHLACMAANQEDCVAALTAGDLLAIAPGGSRESLYAEGYHTMWNGRTGFAEVALKSQVQIIPVFTQNIQQAYMSMKSGMFMWRAIFERTRYPIVPIWGGFPVKLITHIGEPIISRPGETAEQLKDRVNDAIEGLIRIHQDPKIGLVGALKERWATTNPTTTTTMTTSNNNYRNGSAKSVLTV